MTFLNYVILILRQFNHSVPVSFYRFRKEILKYQFVLTKLTENLLRYYF